MREIKFRGRRTYDKKWIYGNLVIDEKGDKHIVTFDKFYEDGHHLKYDDETDEPVFFDEETIGQYTESHSKDGKEIYGGDIIEGYSWKEPYALKTKKIAIGWVNFSPDCGWYFCTNNLDGSYRGLPKGFRTIPDLEDCEIIGNIHDNPELIQNY